MSITTTTRKSDLEGLLEILQSEQDAKLDVIVPATKLRSKRGLIHVEGASLFGETVLRPTDIFIGDVADKLGIPVKYLRTLASDRPDLFDANVNGWLHGNDDDRLPFDADGRKFFLRAFDTPNVPVGIARSLQSDRYSRTDHLDVLFAALEGVQAAGGAQFLDADLSERRLTVRFASDSVAALAPELLKGYRNPFAGRTGPHGEALGQDGAPPTVFAGFELTNSETGGGAFTIQARLIVQICSNGLKVEAGKLRKIHLGGKQDEGIIKVSQDTEQKRLAVITAEARDAVATFLDRDFVVAAIAGLEEKAGKPIADPTATVEAVGKALSFSEEARAGILRNFIAGGQVTAGGVLQAVTAYAQEVADPDVAFDLESNAVAALELAYAA